MKRITTISFDRFNRRRVFSENSHGFARISIVQRERAASRLLHNRTDHGSTSGASSSTKDSESLDARLTEFFYSIVKQFSSAALA